MNAATWPEAELVELHLLFQKLRASPVADRRELAFQCALHPAAMRRLTKACRRLRRQLRRDPTDLDDLLQESLLHLVGELSSERLGFKDAGFRPFGAWYWMLCQRACHKAMKRCGARHFQSLHDICEEDAPPVPEPQWLKARFEEVMAAIARIGDPRVKGVMIDAAAGVKQCQTALDYNISRSAVCKLRRVGIALVRRSCLGELASTRRVS